MFLPALKMARKADCRHGHGKPIPDRTIGPRRRAAALRREGSADADHAAVQIDERPTIVGGADLGIGLHGHSGSRSTAPRTPAVTAGVVSSWPNPKAMTHWPTRSSPRRKAGHGQIAHALDLQQAQLADLVRAIQELGHLPAAVAKHHGDDRRILRGDCNAGEDIAVGGKDQSGCRPLAQPDWRGGASAVRGKAAWPRASVLLRPGSPLIRGRAAVGLDGDHRRQTSAAPPEMPSMSVAARPGSGPRLTVDRTAGPKHCLRRPGSISSVPFWPQSYGG